MTQMAGGPVLAGVVMGYLLGSLSFAVIVSRVMGLSDPRTYGSGNPGATNVLRSGNRKAALATLLLDALKGLVAVLLARAAPAEWGLGAGAVALIGVAAFVGHVWPVFFRFEGGKGVATAAGVLLGMNAALGGAALAVWLAVAVITRYSSLAALVTAALAPVLEFWLSGSALGTAAVAAMSAVLIWRHAANIRKLLAGTESKIGQKAAPSPSTPPSAPSQP